jgi:two-component system response regulator HupR/HoxA
MGLQAIATPALLFDEANAASAALAAALGREFSVTSVGDDVSLVTAFDQQDIALAFVGVSGDGAAARAALGEIGRRWPQTVRIGLTSGDDAAVFGLEAAGADIVLDAKAPGTALRLAARHARRLFKTRRELDRQRVELALRGPRARRADLAAVIDPPVGRDDPFARIIRAPGSPMSAICAAAARIAGFDVPALILGETGTGKELLARAMHGVSRRSDRPFHALNCGAIPDELLESELFGHRRGAFTGAHADRVGLLEQADRGTVFLDEIGETSPAFQVKLLRFLQEGEIRPVGSNETRRVDVRVIAACNRDLSEVEVETGFRSDLYWRLAVAPLHVPPLRDRPEDLPLIAEAVLDRAMEAHGAHVDGMTRETLALLAGWRWPGNIRELENEITRMLVMATGHKLTPDLVAPRILNASPAEHGDARADPVADDCIEASGSLKDRVERLEARIIRATLIRHKGNKSRASEELGLSRVGLRAKLDRYGLGRRDAVIRAAE